jgi:hypothetical protein
VYALQLVEVLAIDFGIRTEEVEVCAQRLPFALRLRLLLCQLVALALMNVKNFDLHVLGALRQISEHCSTFAQIPDHVAADIAVKDRARERILEQDLYHLSNLRFDVTVSAVAAKSTEKLPTRPAIFSHDAVMNTTQRSRRALTIGV